MLSGCFDLGNLGGGKRDRTDDPLLAKQVLYQLSYAPSILFASSEALLLAACFSWWVW